MNEDKNEIVITVNGTNLLASQGQNLLGFLLKNGIRIPSPCYSSEIRKQGWCQLCIVEINGETDLRRACGVTIRKNMQVITNSELIEHTRKENLAALFEKHYKKSVCSECIWNGGCELHNLAEEFGLQLQEK